MNILGKMEKKQEKYRRPKIALRDKIEELLAEEVSESDTPDAIIAEYLESCLKAFDTAVNARDDYWDGNQVL
jgi:hypothetical protein